MFKIIRKTIPICSFLWTLSTQAQVTVKTSDELTFAAKVAGNKILIAASFQIKNRIEVADNVTIDGQGKTISSKLFFTEFRHFESFSIRGKNVTFKNLNLQGDDADVRNWDSSFYQMGIRIYSDSFIMKQCTLSRWGWAAVYAYRMGGMLIDSCYFGDQKNVGYGYAIYADGVIGQSATVRNCVFYNNVAAVDAGGQSTLMTIQNCITDAPFTCHKSGNDLGFAGLLVEGCTLIDCNSNFPAPQNGGYLIVRNNLFSRDSTCLGLKSANPNSNIQFTGNKFNVQPIVFLSAQIKSSARFTPYGYFQVQALVDDTLKLQIDASEIWQWNKVALPISRKQHKISFRLLVIKDAPYSCQLWIDEINLPNGGFEDSTLLWRQAFVGKAAGSGVTNSDFYSGKSSWRFEYRVPALNPDKVVIPAGSSATIYQTTEIK